MKYILKQIGSTIVGSIIIIFCLILLIPVCMVWALVVVADELHYVGTRLIHKKLIYKRRFASHGYKNCYRLYYIKHNGIEYCFSEYFFINKSGYLLYEKDSEVHGKSTIIKRLPQTRNELELILAYL